MARTSGFRLKRGRYKPYSVVPSDPPPEGGSEHAFFEALVESPYHYRSWHLRTQDQVRAQAKTLGGRTGPYDTNYVFGSDDYDTPQDAAKIIIPENIANYEQLWMNLDWSAAKMGTETSKLMVTWDFWYDKSFNLNHRNTNAHVSAKSFQFRRNQDRIYFEWRNRFTQQIPLEDTDDYVSWSDIRRYNEFLPIDPPHGYGGSYDDGPTTGYNYGSDTIGPFANEWRMSANKWQRFWVQFTQVAGTDRVTIDTYIADEDRDPVPFIQPGLTGQLRKHNDTDPDGEIHHFDIEFNYSQNRIAGPWIGYVRNVCALVDVPDFTEASEGYPGLVKPLRTE